MSGIVLLSLQVLLLTLQTHSRFVPKRQGLPIVAVLGKHYECFELWSDFPNESLQQNTTLNPGCLATCLLCPWLHCLSILKSYLKSKHGNYFISIIRTCSTSIYTLQIGCTLFSSYFNFSRLIALLPPLCIVIHIVLWWSNKYFLQVHLKITYKSLIFFINYSNNFEKMCTIYRKYN